MKSKVMLHGCVGLCLLGLFGCATTTTTTRVPRGNPGRPGVDVRVHEDGTLMLYGNPIEKRRLVRRLIREEDAHKGRAIVLHAKGDVRRERLVELRDYLVANRIPNVVIVTQLNAHAYDETSPYWRPPPQPTPGR